jgi:general secretion pathway protein G
MGIIGRKAGGGFTIVEIMVVVVVLGILASIILVYYPNYQRDTRNSQRKSDVSQIAAALSAYAIQKNSYIEAASGCGYLGTGNGWFNAGPSDVTSYQKSIATCLTEAGVFNKILTDPSGCLYDSGGACGTAAVSPVKAYMKATCTKDGAKITYVMAYLEDKPRIDSTIDALCDAGRISGFTSNWGTRYGMNYYVIVK